MKNTTKQWLKAAFCLVLLGGIVFVAVMTAFHWDFGKLSTARYETNTHSIQEDFQHISLHTDTADIFFALSEDGTCYVECYEDEKAKHSVAVREDTLCIDVKDERAWYNRIGFYFDSPRITVYLPRAEYASLTIEEDTGDVEIPKDFAFDSVDFSLHTGDVKFFAATAGLVKIKTTTGDIRAENISAGALDLSVSTGRVDVCGVDCKGDIKIKVSTGKVNLTDTACQNLFSNGSTGDIAIRQTTAANQFSIERSTGDILFDHADAAEIFVQTDTGDVKGSLLTEKVFIARTDTGRLDVPKTITGGRCEITTDTGNISLIIAN